MYNQNRREFGCQVCAVLAAIATGGLPFRSFAEGLQFSAPKSGANYIDVRVDAMRKHSRSARKQFERNMSQSELSVARSIKFTFIPLDINNATAFKDKEGKRRIEMFVGIMRSIEMIAICRALSQVPEHKDKASKWLLYVAEEIKDRIDNPAAFKTSIEGIWEFVGVNDQVETAKFWSTHPDLRQTFDMECACSIAFLTGHEVGHHLADHVSLGKADLSQRREREEQADSIAVRLMARTDYSPLGAMPLFLSFVVWDPESHLYEDRLTHPDPKRRALRAIDSGAEEALADPGFVEYLMRRGTLDKFNQSIAGAKNGFCEALEGLGSADCQ